MLRDVGVAVFNARQQKLEQQILFGFDVVVERALEHADVARDIFDGSGVKALSEKNIGGALQHFLKPGAGFGLGSGVGRASRARGAWARTGAWIFSRARLTSRSETT